MTTTSDSTTTVERRPMAEGIGSTRDTTRRRGTRQRVITFLLATLVSLAGILTASPASAYDANCTLRTMTGFNSYNSVVPQEGVGLVGWNTRLTTTARDMCNHGGLTVTVTVGDSNVRYKGGTVFNQRVQFQRSGSSTWYTLPTQYGGVRNASGYSWTYGDGGHLDLSPQTRVAQVRVYSYLNFNGVLSGGRWHTCNLISRTCS